MKLTEKQIKEILPHIKKAFSNLFDMWDSLREVENIIAKEIETADLTSSSLSICMKEELTDERLISFIKEEL